MAILGPRGSSGGDRRLAVGYGILAASPRKEIDSYNNPNDRGNVCKKAGRTGLTGATQPHPRQCQGKVG